MSWIAERLGVAPARTDAPPRGPSRRVLSADTRARLGVALAYPSFREGLAELLPGGPPSRAPP